MTTRHARDSNVELIRSIFKELAHGGASRFVDALADDVVLTVTGDYSWSRSFVGKDSVLRDLYGYVNTRLNGHNRIVATNIIDGGDWVVVEALGDNTTTEGTPYRNHYCLLYRLSGGRIVEIREYEDSQLCERVLGTFPSAPEPAPLS